MEDRKKQRRGLDEVSHFFLSCQSPPDEAKKLTVRESRTDPREIISRPDDTLPKEELREAVSTADDKKNLCLIFPSNSLNMEKSFLACNLALELIRRNFSVGLIETTTRLPNTFFLLGSLFPGSTYTESAAILPEDLSKVLPTVQALETLRLMDILIGERKKITAVYLREFDSADSFPILERLSNESHFLIINLSAQILELERFFSFLNPFFIIPVTVNSEILLESYLLIKQISKIMACREVGVLIIEEKLYHKAESAFNMIAEMVKRFLSTNICFMGAIPKGADFARSILIRTPLLLEGGYSPISQSIRKLADNVIEKFNHIEGGQKR